MLPHTSLLFLVKHVCPQSLELPYCVTRNPAFIKSASQMSDFHDTMDQLTFARENRERIHAVENSFGPSGRPLDKPDRILMGEGHLMKQGRRKLEQKAFFLFNDILVYGSMVLNGRWHKKQKIIPLGKATRPFFPVAHQITGCTGRMRS